MMVPFRRGRILSFVNTERLWNDKEVDFIVRATTKRYTIMSDYYSLLWTSKNTNSDRLRNLVSSFYEEKWSSLDPTLNSQGYLKTLFQDSDATCHQLLRKSNNYAFKDTLHMDYFWIPLWFYYNIEAVPCIDSFGNVIIPDVVIVVHKNDDMEDINIPKMKEDQNAMSYVIEQFCLFNKPMCLEIGYNDLFQNTEQVMNRICDLKSYVATHYKKALVNSIVALKRNSFSIFSQNCNCKNGRVPPSSHCPHFPNNSNNLTYYW